MRVPVTARRELAGGYNRFLMVLYIFDHKTQHLSNHAPHCGISTSQKCTSMISYGQIYYNNPCFVKQQHLWNIVIQPEVGCYNLWINTRCSGRSPLGEISLWRRTTITGIHITWVYTNVFDTCTGESDFLEVATWDGKAYFRKHIMAKYFMVFQRKLVYFV